MASTSYHYLKAERLAELAVELIAQSVREKIPGLRRAARDDAHLYLRAAQIHAVLATASGLVEHEVAPAERLAARSPLPTARPALEPHPEDPCACPALPAKHARSNPACLRHLHPKPGPPVPRTHPEGP